MPVSLLKKGSLLLVEGLDTSKPSEYISDSASPNNQNFFVDRDLLTKRAGASTLGTGNLLGEEIMFGIELAREGSNYNVRIGLDSVQRYDTGSTSWVSIGHTPFTGTTDDLFDVAIPLLSGKQILVIGNGVDSPFKWTGSGNTAALGGTPPVAKFYQEYQTYLVAANIQGGTDIDSRVQWSDTAAPETWSSGNAGSRDLVEDGGEITGLNIFGNYLSVHKSTSIYLGYLVSTTAVFRFERKSTGAGTCANNSIVNLPTGEQLFLASDGLRLFNGITATLLDSPINDEIRDGLNSNKRHKAWGILIRELDEAWVGIPIGSQEHGETVYKFNYVSRVVYKDTRSGANFAWKAAQSNSITWDDAVGTWDSHTDRWNETSLSALTPLIYIGDSVGKTVYVNSLASDDDGTAIDAFWESKDFESEDKRICRWEEMQLWAKGGSITVEYSTNSGVTWVEASNSPVTLSDDFPTDDSPDMIYFDVISSKIRFRLSNAETGEALAIKQFIVGYKPREFRR